MDSTKIQNNGLNEISYLIWNFIAEKSFELSKKILPENQLTFLPDISLFQSDSRVIYDYLYVIDRFCNTKIFPHKYDIKYSTKFNRAGLSDEEDKNLDLIIATLQCNERSNFEILNKFFPKSSGKYLSKHYNSLDYRYNVDFSGSIWGLKHLHLKEIDRGDKLLYYAIIDNTIYFIAIGNHEDMYKKNLLEIIVNEFQSILPDLGIGHYNDMPFDNFDNLSKDDVQKKWVNGENIGFFINEKFFVSVNSMAGSRIKANLNYEISNITHQISNQATEFIKSVVNEQEEIQDLDIQLDIEYDLSKKVLLIKEENQKIANFFYINYLQRLNTAKILVETYCN